MEAIIRTNQFNLLNILKIEEPIEDSMIKFYENMNYEKNQIKTEIIEIYQALVFKR